MNNKNLANQLFPISSKLRGQGERANMNNDSTWNQHLSTNNRDEQMLPTPFRHPLIGLAWAGRVSLCKSNAKHMKELVANSDAFKTAKLQKAMYQSNSRTSIVCGN